MGDCLEILNPFSFLKYLVIKYSKKSEHELASLGLKANNQLMVRENTSLSCIYEKCILL